MKKHNSFKKTRGGGDTYALSKYWFWVPGAAFLLIILLVTLLASKYNIHA